MSDNQPEEQGEQGIDFDYLVDGENVETIVILKDPDKFRQCVDASMQWVPAVQGGEGTYPGAEEMDRLEKAGEYEEFPILVVRHAPSNKPQDEAVEEIQHQMYLMGPDQVINLIGTGIHMFTKDENVTNTLMKVILFALFANNHDDEDGEIPVSEEAMEKMTDAFTEYLKQQEDDGDEG